MKEKDDNQETYTEFKKLVNMTASELEKWLKTEESKTTGLDSGDGEAIGHKSGKMIVDILEKKKADLTEDDFHQMHRVISYISRHKAQKPDGDVSETKWNYSLKNWGYDYSKK
jgi:protein subunit release factor B